MKRLFAGLLLCAAFAAASCAPMGTTATVQIRSAPPPPSFTFDADPQFNYLSDRQVGVIADDRFGYDMFSASGYFYLYDSGYWYRAPSAHGPFVAVEMRRVPQGIFDVDDHQYRWRNHPQGWRGHANGGDRNDSHGNDNGGPGH